MLQINSRCGHTGAVSDHHLPRELQCSVCGSRRVVEPEHCRAIYSQDRFQEWVSGTRERPQVRRRAASLPAS
jgi:hypothetical protein